MNEKTRVPELQLHKKKNDVKNCVINYKQF